MNQKFLVLGLGNTLQTDEGIGVHVINHLQQNNYIDYAEFIDGGTMGFDLVHPIESTDQLVVIDTAELDSAPGSVRVFEGMDMDTFIATARKTSAHEVGLQDALSMALLNGRLPAHRALIGIQPKQFGWGDWPTDEVAGAIPEVCDRVFELAREWKA